MDHPTSKQRNLKSGDDWSPQQIAPKIAPKINSKRRSSNNRRACRSGGNNNQRGALSESFTNLEDAIALAKQESLKSLEPVREGKVMTALEQSFCDLDLALAQAQHNSLQDIKVKSNDSRVKGRSNSCDKNNQKSLFQSFKDLDDAMALAIQNSLDGKDHGLKESFCNLEGALEQAKRNSMSSEGGGGNSYKLRQSFSMLDDAIKQAMRNSLSDIEDEGSVFSGDDAQYLENLDEDNSYRDSFRDSFQSEHGDGTRQHH